MGRTQALSGLLCSKAVGLGLGLFRFPSILYKVIDHKDIEIVKYIKSIQNPNVNC
jgi:hypothetical protein